MGVNWFIAFSVVAPNLVLTPPSQVRAFHTDDLHATIAFLGSVGEARARAGWNALSIAFPPREVRLGRVRLLGATALSSIVDDTELARTIGETRDPICRAAEARIDERPPLPHVTLARIARRATPAETSDAIAWAHGLALENVPARIDRVALYAGLSDRTTRMFRIVESRTPPP